MEGICKLSTNQLLGFGFMTFTPVFK